MNKELFLREFMEEIWNKKNFEKVEKYVHNEYKIYLDPGDPWENKTLNHYDFCERMLTGSFDAFPDLNFEITSAIEDENHVAITWILTGSNLGKINKYPATTKKVRVNGMTIYHFREDLISGHTQVFDRNLVMKQLGFI